MKQPTAQNSIQLPATDDFSSCNEYRSLEEEMREETKRSAERKDDDENTYRSLFTIEGFLRQSRSW